MRRIETYVGQQIYEWAFSAQAQYTMTAIAKISSALLGTAGTVNGLACTPTGPATMAVQIGAGEVYQVEPIEATACGTLPQNTATSILKQGIQLGTFTTGTFATPTTSGQSINYLIECQYQDSDISLDPTTGNSPVVLQFYNSANPSTPWSGPNNSGATSNTFRDGVVAYQIKAGVAATTGSQVTPSPDTGWIGLWVVTVPFGASSLTSSNISAYTGAPVLPSGILQSIVTSNLTYGVDNGTANVVQATFPLPVTTLTDGMDIWVKIKNANTGATTFTPNPGVVSASPVVGAAHAALQGGELVANGRANFVWRQDITSWVLVECTGAAIQVAPATASQHAVQAGQVAGVVGSAQNLKLYVTAASASGTLTADEVIAETSLGGVRYCLPSFSKTINLATTGAGGMDVGTSPANTWVAIYVMYNPSTSASCLLGVNAANSFAPSIYGGANAPSGFTASALVSVWRTNGSGQFTIGSQRNRKFSIANQIVINTGVVSSPTALAISGFVPANATRVGGTMTAASTAAGSNTIIVATDTNLVGQQFCNGGQTAGGTISTPYFVDVATNQQIAYQTQNSTGSPTWNIYISSYEI